VFQIVANGVDSNKLIVGKPVTTADATNTGFMDLSTLTSVTLSAVATNKVKLLSRYFPQFSVSYCIF
jgi:hypothetical protein